MFLFAALTGLRPSTLNSGFGIPSLGLGTWLSAPGDVYKIVKEALKLGCRHVDCSHIYQNEKEVGMALKEAMSELDLPRSELFITSKLWNNSHQKDLVQPALEKTLEDLELDYLDLYLIHWPVAFKAGITMPSVPEEYLSLDEVPILETYKAMEELVTKGLTRSIGVSNFGVERLKELVEEATIMPAMNQVESHPYFQQKELLNYCRSQGILMTAYSPLGSSGRPEGMLSGDEQWILEDPIIVDIASRHQKSPAQILIAWAIQRGTVVIPKTIKKHRAEENLMSKDLELSLEDMSRIESLYRNRRYSKGDFFAPKGSPYTVESIWR